MPKNSYHTGIKKPNLENHKIPENTEVLDESIRYRLNKINPMIFELTDELKERLKEWESINEVEFKATIKSLKYIFKENLLVLPRDWKEVFYEWYIDRLDDEKFYLSFEKLKEKISDRNLILEWAEDYSNSFKKISKEQSEKLKNLPHKLCLLEDLGILDLIEERFKDKHYLGKARETDKARLLALLFEIDDSEKVRQALKNKDFLSGKAKSNAIQTLKNHGLDSKKLRD